MKTLTLTIKSPKCENITSRIKVKEIGYDLAKAGVPTFSCKYGTVTQEGVEYVLSYKSPTDFKKLTQALARECLKHLDSVPTKAPVKKMKFRWSSKEDLDSSTDCIHCGKWVNPKSCAWIEVIDGGANICVPGTGDETDPGYMGYYPIGSTCKKKFEGFYTEKL